MVGVLDFLDLSRLRLPPRAGVFLGAEIKVYNVITTRNEVVGR